MDEDAADLLQDFLVQMGFDVAVANDLPAALRMATSFKPQFALLDIGLPLMDGWELGQRLRDQGGHEAVKLIAVTGYGQDRDRSRSLECGFVGHLTKPVDLSMLARMIGN